MADVKELILTIVRPLVSQPEAVSLEIEESTDFLEYNLTVAKEDIGPVSYTHLFWLLKTVAKATDSY